MLEHAQESQMIRTHQTLVDPNLSNEEFLKRYAGAGRVCLVGGKTLTERFIRRAQRRLTQDASSSDWGHAFLFQGLRVDGQHWLIESDIDVHRSHANIGVQEHRIDKYFDGETYDRLAVLDFGLSATAVSHVLTGALDLRVRRAQYSLREVMATYMALRRPRRRVGQSNRFSRGEKAIFCSALVQHLFEEAGVILSPDVHAKLAAPEDLFQSSHPHQAFLLKRIGA